MGARLARDAVVLAAAVALVFGASLGYGFVWDDHLLLVGKPVYGDFDLPRIFLGLANDLEYLPVRDVSYAVDAAVWGLTPFGFHLTNLLLYWANCVAVYLLARRIALVEGVSSPGWRPESVGLVTALLFCVHPLHSEVVSFVTCRNVLLSGLFSFLCCSFFLYARSAPAPRRVLFWLGVVFCMVLALFAKATAVVMPGLLLVLALADGRPLSAHRRTFLSVLPLAVIAVGVAVLHREIAQRTGLMSDELVRFGTASITSRIAIAAQIPFFYLGKLILPIGLSTHYGEGLVPELSRLPAAAAVAAHVLAIGLALRFRRRHPWWFLTYCWYVVSLFPVLNLFPTTPVVADRYAFNASFAFCLACALGLAELVCRDRRRLAAATTTAMLALWAVLAAQRSRVWRDDVTLFSAAIESSPGEIAPYQSLAHAYEQRGDRERALAFYLEAQELSPGVAEPELLRGRIALDEGRYRAALEWFEAAVARDGQKVEAFVRAGMTLERLGRPIAAIERYGQGLRAAGLDPTGELRATARERIAALQRAEGPRLDALRASVQAAPRDLRARGELALALDRTGLYEEAIASYQAMLELGFTGWELPYNLANAFRRTGDDERAALYYEQAIEANPDAVDALNNLGLVYRRLGHVDRAISCFERGDSARSRVRVRALQPRRHLLPPGRS